ncbi:MAG: hypothetical protein EZS28_001429 [Streblomastix strix]|uniref:Uncharacterized protein n=1 Tax=Streblomastix strix TaxID=222440 RepID=A0A5J4X743_9EUKA|nr:MAG: hypothetical protein EZS28_001429 [Streblomastix strix]
MISSIERNQFRMSKSKKQIEDMKKELSEEDNLRLQSIDQALRNLAFAPVDQQTSLISSSQQETKENIEETIGDKTFSQPIVATKIIKTGGTSNQLLLANGDTTDVGDFLPKQSPHVIVQLIIESSDSILDQGIRIMKNKANWDSFVLIGCNTNLADKDGVWKVGSTSSQFRIQKQEDYAYDYKGLIINFDCTSLKFNNQIIAPSPIELATQQSIAYEMYESRSWDTLTAQNDRVYISLLIAHSDPNTEQLVIYLQMLQCM